MRFLRLGLAGMRGEIGTALTPPLAIDYAAALGTYLEGGRVVVARDTRFSSEMLYRAVISSLLSRGCRVLDAGVCPAPLLHFMVPRLSADGGMLIGAGHHPAGWNALAPVDETGACFNSVRTQELLDVYHSRKYDSKQWNKIGQVEDVPEAMADDYVGMLSKIVPFKPSRRYKIIADFCNGSGSIIGRKLADKLGIEMIPINDVMTGVLPHDPEPRPRSSAQVQSIMKVLKADAGFVFNSDMSRMAVVTNSGETLSEEYTCPLVADQVLTESGGGIVVTNSCTTRTLDEIVEKHHATINKTKVGQAPVIDRMREVNAVFAGDGSGSVAGGKGVSGFDGFWAMAVILQAMERHKCGSAALASKLPRYNIVKRKVHCPSAHAYTLLRNMNAVFEDAEMTEVDGFRFDWPDGWVHLRASATEPIMRMIVEWKTLEEAEERATRVRGLLERLVAS